MGPSDQSRETDETTDRAPTIGLTLARRPRDRRDRGPSRWRGPREMRTTRPSGDHYLYESRDPPKNEGGGWLASPQGRRGPRRPPPSPTGTAVPPVPMVPEGVEDPLGGLVGRPEPREAGLRFLRPALAPRIGTIEGDGPDAAGETCSAPADAVR
jgi:hypothetical protein